MTTHSNSRIRELLPPQWKRHRDAALPFDAAVSNGERTMGCGCGTLRLRGAEECGPVAKQVG